MDQDKKLICIGCEDEMKKGDEFIKVKDIVVCDYCIGHNWHIKE